MAVGIKLFIGLFQTFLLCGLGVIRIKERARNGKVNGHAFGIVEIDQNNATREKKRRKIKKQTNEAVWRVVNANENELNYVNDQRADQTKNENKTKAAVTLKKKVKTYKGKDDRIQVI